MGEQNIRLGQLTTHRIWNFLRTNGIVWIWNPQRRNFENWKLTLTNYCFSINFQLLKLCRKSERLQFALAHAESVYRFLLAEFLTSSHSQTFGKNYLSADEKISATNCPPKNFVGTWIILNLPDFCKLSTLLKISRDVEESWRLFHPRKVFTRQTLSAHKKKQCCDYPQHKLSRRLQKVKVVILQFCSSQLRELWRIWEFRQ